MLFITPVHLDTCFFVALKAISLSSCFRLLSERGAESCWAAASLFNLLISSKVFLSTAGVFLFFFEDDVDEDDVAAAVSSPASSKSSRVTAPCESPDAATPRSLSGRNCVLAINNDSFNASAALPPSSALRAFLFILDIASSSLSCFLALLPSTSLSSSPSCVFSLFFIFLAFFCWLAFSSSSVFFFIISTISERSTSTSESSANSSSLSS
mmetsp:Transcript_46643/g.77499  ORF Transcript_46643/g.77499 Transcript_46643/m.77499 type:complete len:211 (+) Transcript_46643:720-1352(+)